MKFGNIVINRQLLPMKAHYFLWYAGTGPVVPFLSTYSRQLGFSSIVVGVIYTILPICGMVAKPVFGVIADKFHCQKQIFLMSLVLAAAAVLAIYYSPQVPLERKVNFLCHNGSAAFVTYPGSSLDECTVEQIRKEGTVDNCEMECITDPNFWNIVCNDWNAIEYCVSANQKSTLSFTAKVPKSSLELLDNRGLFKVSNIIMNGSNINPICSNQNMSLSCDIECSNYNVNEILTKAGIDDSEVYGLYQFWIFLFLMISFWVMQAIAGSIGDAICFEMLGNKPNRYGYQRMFGSLGWGIFSTIAGFIIDAVSNGQSQKNYLPAFYMAAGILLLDFLSSTMITHTQKNHSPSIFGDVGRLLVDVRIVIYLIWCIAVGLCTGLIWQFMFWLVEDLAREQGCEAMNWVKTLQGVMQAVQCLGGELPFFFFSGWILKKLGHVNTMSLVLLVLGVRLTLYSVIKNPWWFLPVEFSNGLTFGLFFACMASYASIVAPPGTEATMQGLVGAAFEGVGVSLGSFTAGLCYNKYGGPLTFRFFGIGALIAGILHMAVQYFIKFKKSKSEKTDKLSK